MRLIEWEVAEDGYEEQIIIPKEKREEGLGHILINTLVEVGRRSLVLQF